MESKLFRLLKTCNVNRDASQIHVHIFIHGLQGSNTLLGALIHLYSSFNKLQDAFLVFKFASLPNVFLHNTLIKAYNHHNLHRDALLLYKDTRKIGIFPNNYTFAFLLKSVELLKGHNQGEMIHNHVIKSGFESNVFVLNTLIDMYSKCGDLASACKVFDFMPERDVVSWNSMIAAFMLYQDAESAVELFDTMPEVNVVSWNSMIAGYMKLGRVELANTYFCKMPERNVVSWNSMVAGYIQLGDMKAAQNLFDEMPVKSVVSWTSMITGYVQSGDMFSAQELFDRMPVKNVVSWNAIITGYVQNNLCHEALSLFSKMLLADLRPDEVTITGALSACAQMGALNHGRWINSYLDKTRYSISLPIGNSLIDMYAKCGDIDNARRIFEGMPEKCIITWTSMVSGLAFHGHSGEALTLFDRMCREGTKPDDVFFIALLSACTHAGSVEDGFCYFESMENEFCLKPRIEHYGCMVDLLSRAQKFEEALKFIKNMPMKANAVIWATLLGNCKSYENTRVAEASKQEILKLDHLNAGYQVLMSNVHASIGEWSNAKRMRTMMRESEIEKLPGCSFIELDGVIHEFLVADLRHECRRKIYEVIDGLTHQLRIEGYIPYMNDMLAWPQLSSTVLQT